MVVLFAIMILLIANRVLKQGTRNRPALVSVLMGLALPCFVSLLDTWWRFLGPLAPVVAICFIPGLILYTMITLVFGIWGLKWRDRDDPRTGLLWSLTGIALTLLISFISVTNFVGGVQTAYAAKREADMKAEMDTMREERLQRKLATRMERFSAADGSFTVVMPDQMEVSSCTHHDESGSEACTYVSYVSEDVLYKRQFLLLRYFPRGKYTYKDVNPSLSESMICSELHTTFDTASDPRAATRNGMRQWLQTATTTEGYKVRMRSYLAKEQLYILVVVAQSGDFGKDADVFFDSFRIKKKVSRFTREEFKTSYGMSRIEAANQPFISPIVEPKPR